MKNVFLFAAIGLLTGCVQTSSMPLAANVYQVTASAAPACNQASARQVAIKLAAAETIRQGYDSFIITGGQANNDVRVLGTTPVTSNTFGSAYLSGNSVYGSSTTTYSGGYPIFAGSIDQSLIVRMFREGDAGAEQAVSAKQFLGPEWQKIIQQENFLC